MSSGEELKFQKLSEVELLEEAPDGAHVVVEVEGQIKRVAGGLGGGLPTLKLTTPTTLAGNYALNDTDAALMEELYVNQVPAVLIGQNVDVFDMYIWSLCTLFPPEGMAMYCGLITPGQDVLPISIVKSNGVWAVYLGATEESSDSV